jgi:hypothetical protein
MFGTGFIVNKKIKHLVMDFKAKSHTTCRLRIRGQTEEKSEEEKDVFYNNLDKIYDECPKRDIKIIIGDLNAKIDQEEIFKPIIGKYSFHKTSNDNGIGLISPLHIIW